MHFLGDIDADTFFAKYWQRQPGVFRSRLDVGTPIGWSKLRELAQRDDIESRLVLEQCGAYPWEVVHGPFEAGELDAFDPAEADRHGGWSLLVHEVDVHVERAAALLCQLDFLPQWQVDDVMVSSAPPGGSVGPHIDRYDAFLVQSQGRRRWQLEGFPRAPEDIALLEGPDLAILATFEPETEYILGPGDVLYVPPGVAHLGVALDPAETWSIGLRALTVHELVTAFVEDALATIPAHELYRDRTPQRRGNSGEITKQNIAEIREILGEVLRTDELERWIGQLMTTSWRGTGRSDPADEAAESSQALGAGQLGLRPGVRSAYIEDADGSILLFVDGHPYHLPRAAAGVARSLANRGSLSTTDLSSPEEDPSDAAVERRLPELYADLFADLDRHGFLLR